MVPILIHVDALYCPRPVIHMVAGLAGFQERSESFAQIDKDIPFLRLESHSLKLYM